MKRLLVVWALAAVAIYAATRLLMADTQITPGAGTAIFNFTCFTTKTCPASVNIDPNGNPIGITGTPMIVQPSGSGTQPVSGDVGVSGTVTANQGTPGPATAPWLMSISQGGNTATVSGGSLQVNCANCSGGGGGGQVTQGAGNAANPWTVIPGPGSTTNVPWTMTIKNATGANTATVDGTGALKTVTNITNTSVPVTGTVTIGSQPVTTTLAPPGATTAGGCTGSHFLSAATTNATAVKSGAGILCELNAINTSTSPADLRLYDVAGAPNCASATGAVANFPIQPNTVGPGFVINLGPYGRQFSTGIGICLTGAVADNDNSAAPTGIAVNYAFK